MKKKNRFLNDNHIQGADKSKYKIGLYYNNELVSVMTFGKRKISKNKNNYTEMIRFCNKKNTIVIGGASKLLTYFENKYNIKNIISYANKRYSNGNLYLKLGLELFK